MLELVDDIDGHALFSRADSDPHIIFVLTKQSLETLSAFDGLTIEGFSIRNGLSAERSSLLNCSGSIFE